MCVPCLSVVGVYSHVSVEISGLREPKETEFALVRLFSTVDAQVLCQCRAVRKRLLAQAAPIVESGVRMCENKMFH